VAILFFPLGLPSPPSLPKPLLPRTMRPPEPAIAAEVNEVESNSVTVGCEFQGW
jgi:hypothetical protein